MENIFIFETIEILEFIIDLITWFSTGTLIGYAVGGLLIVAYIFFDD